MSAVHIGIALAAVLLIFAALSDVRHYLIPNWICLALALAFPLHVALSAGSIAWGAHLACGGLVLLAGFGLFAAGLVGGGDVKLLAAISLWAGPDRISLLLLVTTLVGGVLALGLLVYRRWGKGDPASPLPYGVALAAGGLTILAGLAIPDLMAV